MLLAAVQFGALSLSCSLELPVHSTLTPPPASLVGDATLQSGFAMFFRLRKRTTSSEPYSVGTFGVSSLVCSGYAGALRGVSGCVALGDDEQQRFGGVFVKLQLEPASCDAVAGHSIHQPCLPSGINVKLSRHQVICCCSGCEYGVGSLPPSYKHHVAGSSTSTKLQRLACCSLCSVSTHLGILLPQGTLAHPRLPAALLMHHNTGACHAKRKLGVADGLHPYPQLVTPPTPWC